MSKRNYRAWMFAMSSIFLTLPAQAGVPDSVYVYPYHTGSNGQGGMQVAWSANRTKWKGIGPNHSFVSSDFGTWGAQKKMFHPYTIRLADGTWRSVWQVNSNVNQFAVAESKDLVHWIPQDYPYMKGVSSCLEPVLQFDEKSGEYAVVFKTNEGKYYRTTSTDFYHFTDPAEVEASAYKSATENITINGEVGEGQVTKVPYAVAEYLEMAVAQAQAKNKLYDEKAKDDATRFAGLKNLEAKVTISAADKKEISDKLVGIFFEDISYAADGGLYAELVQNRDFEYNKNDNGGWNALTSWSIQGDGMTMKVATENPIHENNAHYVVLDITTPSASLVNEGFDGIAVKKGEKYDFSLFGKTLQGKGGKCTVQLVSDGKVIGSTSVQLTSSDWKKVTATLTATADASNAQLVLTPQASGSLAMDMISLFPRNTFKGRKNGLRADLAQLLADLKPKFIRFPGGCATHGNGIDNIYHWNETVGSLESRKPDFNIWHYHQTRGLGFYEYFQFCEDIGAEPLPVLAAGVPCQNSSHGGHGQQGGIPMEEMPAYIEEILNLIEWANGDAKTSKWAKMRAEAGHPKPFNLKYLGIGNEDLISKTFEERYLMIIKAVKEKYPNITICGTAGPWCEGSDYEQGWKIAHENHIDMVDEHYYQTPGWFIYNQDYYDQYDRQGPKVYVGEYAAHLPGRPNNIETALAEALHICNLERNGDVVAMSSYAPLLAKDKHTNWNPDMIYFNNTEARPTVGYYAQQMHSLYSGNEYIDTKLTVNESKQGVRERMAVSTVCDTKSGATYIKLVNMMPYSVSTTVSASDVIKAEAQAEAIVLSGTPDAKDSKPATKQVTVSPEFTYEMPAYSFTIIKIKK